MHVLVLGGCGSQGKAALYDLSRNKTVEAITCADLHPGLLDSLNFIDNAKIRAVGLDAADPNALASVMNGNWDVVLDFLPPHCVRPVAQAAIEHGVHLVNTNYAYDILDLHQAAKDRGICIMPECGLDPGIDLVLYNHCISTFTNVSKLNSYCGGVPEKAACDNPLNYKFSWNVEAVIKSQVRDATLIANSESVRIPAEDQHDNAFIHCIDIPGLGTMEAIPNGNAVRYIELLNLGDTLSEAGRYSLRWPGWCAFWAPMKELGFLDHGPVAGLPHEVSPFQMVAAILAPKMQYGDKERDLSILVNTVEGLIEGERKTMTSSLLIQRDLSTGLMAMNMAVAYPACIAAEMIANGEVTQTGILSPAVDLPHRRFLSRLAERGIVLHDKIAPVP